MVKTTLVLLGFEAMHSIPNTAIFLLKKLLTKYITEALFHKGYRSDNSDNFAKMSVMNNNL